ncbi:SoxR reducing system RseC family protein [Clostridium sp. Cult2]|uniref:SoxR reducing system RseC family protein n=1 Tax=Clostridium sp. Cult2 TaxID=2079003 RepID=UPI001F21E7BB|nr:SoxR reducing system RseC family protein [Clostridium sp. Cult2]MCF6465804.1 Fis family transcriptional regulator [Clostridium sp. Cult2]
MEQLGYVRKIIDDIAEVEVRRISGCGGGCSSCGGGCSAPSIVIRLENRIGAKTGDFVEIKAKSRNIIKYALIAYMIPFAMLILGIVLGVNLFQSMDIDYYETLGFAMGVVFLAVSFIIVKFIDRSINKKNNNAMEMVRVLE